MKRAFPNAKARFYFKKFYSPKNHPQTLSLRVIVLYLMRELLMDLILAFPTYSNVINLKMCWI